VVPRILEGQYNKTKGEERLMYEEKSKWLLSMIYKCLKVDLGFYFSPDEIPENYVEITRKAAKDRTPEER